MANGNLLYGSKTHTKAVHQSRGMGWGGRWEGGSKGRGYMYTYGWFMLRFDRKQNSVKQFSSVTQSCPTLRSHGLQHARPPCLSPTPGAYPNSCSLSRWYHPTISSSVIPFSSHLQSFPASGSFTMSQFFTSSGQSIGVSASTSVLPKNTQDWSLGWTG